jgi:uncharacterized protein (TIGR00369 family)
MRVPREATLDGLLGVEITERKAGLVRCRIDVSDAVRQPMGYVHGGVYATIAETLASIGTLDGVAGQGRTAFGDWSSTDVLEPISAGTVEAVARVRHRSDDRWLWLVELRAWEGAICALCHVRVAVGTASELGLATLDCTPHDN